MLTIQLICVGKLKGGFSYLQPGVNDYLKRLKAFAKVELIEVPDETIAPSITDDQVMDREGERLVTMMKRASYVIALSERGKVYASPQLAEEFAKRCLDHHFTGNPSNGGTPLTGSGPIMFLVGGALGLSPKVLEKADWVLSLSKLTFPHPQVRLIILEQLYRTFKILNNQPYHK